MVEIKTLEIIKKAGNGIGSCFYMTLPVFLSKLPVAGFSLVDEKEEQVKEKLSFCKKYTESILNGFQHDEIRFFAENLVSGYCECVYFLILKRFSKILLAEN